MSFETSLGQASTQSETKSRSREVTTGSAIIGRRAEERQIKVFSKHPMIRAHFDAFSRDLRHQFRNILGLFRSDEWSVRYQVYVYGTANDVYSGNDVIPSAEMNAANHFTLKLQVKVHDRFDEESFRLSMIKLFLIEQMLEAYIEAPETFTSTSMNPPDWLVHGFDYFLKHKRLGRPSNFYAGYFKSGQFMGVDEVMEPRKAQGLNSVSLEMFRASSAVLVGALCEQKDGGEAIRSMLRDLALRPDYDPKVLIRKHFPGFRETGQGLDKWWALQLATLAQQQSFEYYTPAETERRLKEALEISFAAVAVPAARAQKANANLIERLRGKVTDAKSRRGPKDQPAFRGDISQYRQFLDRKNATFMLEKKAYALQAIKLKSFPLYRDIFDRYAVVCQALVEKKFDGVDKEIAELKVLRQQITQSLDHTRDYLNYYQATRSPERSKAFESYLKFKDGMNKKALPKRTDSISTYLDKIEAGLPYLGD